MRVLLSICLLAALVASVSGHAYFASPTPRLVYCTTSNCVSPNAQGPVWAWPTGEPLSNDHGVSNSCGTSFTGFTGSSGNPLAFNSSMGSSNPGTANVMTTVQTGSSTTATIFISQVHPGLYNGSVSSDGWQIRGRDAAAGASFSAISLTSYSYTGTTGTVSGSGMGPFNSDTFVAGNLVTVNFNAPSSTTSDYEIQFIWTLAGASLANITGSATYSGYSAMWLSCADLSVQHSGVASAASLSLAALFAMIVALLALF